MHSQSSKEDRAPVEKKVEFDSLDLISFIYQSDSNICLEWPKKIHIFIF